MIAADDPTPSVVDDDAGVRASIQGLLKIGKVTGRIFWEAEEHLWRQRNEDAVKT